MEILSLKLIMEMEVEKNIKNGKLKFEGEYLNGNKNGEGKEYCKHWFYEYKYNFYIFEISH